MATSEEEITGHEARFLGLISGLSSTVMQHLGKVVNPLTGKVEKNLDAAKEMIEMLRMLKEKTQGNLTDREERALHALLSSVQLNYLDELKAEAEKPKERAAEGKRQEPPPKEEKAEERAEEPAPAQQEKQAAVEEEEVPAEPNSQEKATEEGEPSEREKGKRRERKKSKRQPSDE